MPALRSFGEEVVDRVGPSPHPTAIGFVVRGCGTYSK